jgi:NAD(P)-dependent dehydrogenase (short-subunit alcohol dehydrogenase family)
VAEKCRSFGVHTLVIQADVSKWEDLIKLFDQVVKELGHLDIVFSNAGIEHWGKPDELDEVQIDKVCFFDRN